MTEPDPMSLATVRLLDTDYSEIHVWTGYLVPFVDDLPNKDSRARYYLTTNTPGGHAGGIWSLSTGPLRDCIWNALTTPHVREFILRDVYAIPEDQ